MPETRALRELNNPRKRARRASGKVCTPDQTGTLLGAIRQAETCLCPLTTTRCFIRGTRTCIRKMLVLQQPFN